MNNNSDVFIAQIKEDLIKEFKKNASSFSNKIDKIQQDTIQDFNIPDTGFLQLKTFTKFQTNLSSNIIAEATFITRGVNYAGYVVTGTSRFPVARNYLETARNQTMDLIKDGSYTRVYKQGGRSKRQRTNQRRKF